MMGSRSRKALVWWLAYGVMVVAVVVGMMSARRWALEQLSTARAASQWEAWRDDVRRQDENASVARKVPRSDQPPALVLMRDYFVTCLVAAIVISSLLFGVIALFVTGATDSRQTGPQAS